MIKKIFLDLPRITCKDYNITKDFGITAKDFSMFSMIKCFFEFSIAHSIYFKAENIKDIFLNWQNSTEITSVFHFSASKLESVINIIKINVPQKVVILIERGTLWSSIRGLKVKEAVYISNVSNKICPILLSFTISTYWEIFINKQMFFSFI